MRWFPLAAILVATCAFAGSETFAQPTRQQQQQRQQQLQQQRQRPGAPAGRQANPRQQQQNEQQDAAERRRQEQQEQRLRRQREQQAQRVVRELRQQVDFETAEWNELEPLLTQIVILREQLPSGIDAGRPTRLASAREQNAGGGPGGGGFTPPPGYPTRGGQGGPGGREGSNGTPGGRPAAGPGGYNDAPPPGYSRGRRSPNEPPPQRGQASPPPGYNNEPPPGFSRGRRSPNDPPVERSNEQPQGDPGLPSNYPGRGGPPAPGADGASLPPGYPGAPPGDDDAGVADSEVGKRRIDLEKLLASDEPNPREVAQALQAYREAREAHMQELEVAQAQVREIVDPLNEALLVTTGILD